jgi:TolA-binding protein
MRSMKTMKLLLIAGGLALAAFLSAQTAKTDVSDRFDQGLVKFEKSDFSSALSIFQGILLDPAAKSRHPEAAYWSALAYVGLKDYDNADRTMGLFLTSYPSAPLYSDALYQQGRIAFLRQEHDRALTVFQNFLETYPKSDLYPSALFWAGECMYQLGKLKQAEIVFQSIVKEYPEGIKTEAANYRLGLIDLKYREEELLKLLKWSHEESLRIIEEYQGREKTYEQALNAYQKQIAQLKGGGASVADLDKVASLESEAAARKAESEKLSADAASLRAALAKAETERDQALASLASAKKGEASASDQSAIDAKSANKHKALLDMKQSALELKEFYMEWLQSNASSGGGK